jgi:hypothetical protein
MKPLNPIMAVLVIASVGATPLRTLAADGDKSAPVAAAEDKNPVNALSRILAANPAARTDAGKRMEEFLLNPNSNGKSFLGDGVDRVALGAVAREWGEKAGAIGSVSMLYFVTGPGLAVPGWALKDPILSKTFVSGMKWEGRLRGALSAPEPKDPNWKGKDWTGKNQIKKTQEKSQATAFLNDAAEIAATVFSDPRTKAEIDLSVAANNTTAPVVPNTQRSPRTGLDAMSRQYTLDDLYRDGAVVKDLTGPGDEGSRRISMKIYTKRVNGVIVNEVGIFDISDSPDDIYGQRFQIGVGKQSFVLDDRTAGHKKYELTFGPADGDGNRAITFGRPDVKGDGALTTSTSELFLKRAEQAGKMGNIVNVGGQDFYVLPQGGARSALALFPKALIDGPPPANSRYLEPALFAEVGTRGPNGRNQNIAGKPQLGTVGKTEFHLEFNADLGIWEAKEGAGDPPPTTGGNTGSGNTGSGNTGGGNPGGISIVDRENFLMTTMPGCTRKPDDTKDLAPDLKGKYGMLSCDDKIKGHQNIIVNLDSAKDRTYGTVEGYKLLRARFFDHYVVLQFDKQQQYLDLLKWEKDANGEFSYAISGFVMDKSASKFSEAKALADALKYYMGIKDGSADAGAITEVPKRAATVMAGKSFELNAGFPKDVLVVTAVSGGDVYHLWPTVKLPGGGTVPTPNPYTTLNGPANALDGDVSSVNVKFEDKFETTDKRMALIVGTLASAEAQDFALYVSSDPIGKDTVNRYFAALRYRSPDPTEVHVFRQKYIEVFNKDNPYPAVALQMGGLAKVGAVVASRGAAGYKFISGTTKEKGVYAMFQNKQVSATNAQQGAANCVGPLMWWGLDRDEAKKVCENDKF